MRLSDIGGKLSEGYRVVPGFDRDKYQERQGLEGPFHTKSGKVVYYDKVEGKYYDPDTDMYIEYEDWQAMNEAGEDTFMSALKGLKSWQVVIMNNYYRGKYADYSGRYYYVLASSPEEAEQVVLDNADAILQDLLSMKSVNGRKILPRGSAVRITADRIGKIKDGTEAGRMTTAGFKKMFGPQGPLMVKLTNGAIADVQGQEQGVAEGSEERGQNRLWAMITDYEQRAKATKNDIKKAHYLKMASELRGKLKTSDEQGVVEGVDPATYPARAKEAHEKYLKYENLVDQELRKFGQRLPKAWDAARMMTKLSSDPKYALALKYYKLSEKFASLAIWYEDLAKKRQGVAEGVTPASTSKVLRLIQRHRPEWFDTYGIGEVEDTVVDLADMGQFSGMSATDALELVGQELESLYGQQGVAEGSLDLKDRQDYMSRKKAIQDLQMDPATAKNPTLKTDVMRRKAELEKAARAKGFVKEDASGLNIGDPVIITGNVEFNGKTGDIVGFGRDNAFVIVDLYNHGKHSFHSSDVSFNDYADSDEEEARMYDAGEFRDDVDEGYLDRPGQVDSPVASAIVRRILLQRTDLLSRYGPVYVMQAIDDVADGVGDVDEIGSSDVSGWVKQVEWNLKNKLNQYDEPMENKELNPEAAPKSALGKALWRDLGKFKKASPAQQQRNKDRWAASPHNPINKAK